MRERYPYSKLFWSLFSRNQSKCEKIRTRKTPNTGNIHAMYSSNNFHHLKSVSSHNSKSIPTSIMLIHANEVVHKCVVPICVDSLDSNALRVDLVL